MKRTLFSIDCCCWSFALFSITQAFPVTPNSQLGNNALSKSTQNLSLDVNSVCVYNGVSYPAGVNFTTDNPCQTCTCNPPEYKCTFRSCDIKPGCKAIHKANKCCPEYLCECEINGKTYGNGEKVEEPNPCKVCYCKGGEIKCALVTCYSRDDCEAIHVPGKCCPKYDHCPPLEVMKSKATPSKPALVVISDLSSDLNTSQRQYDYGAPHYSKGVSDVTVPLDSRSHSQTTESHIDWSKSDSVATLEVIEILPTATYAKDFPFDGNNLRDFVSWQSEIRKNSSPNEEVKLVSVALASTPDSGVEEYATSSGWNDVDNSTGINKISTYWNFGSNTTQMFSSSFNNEAGDVLTENPNIKDGVEKREPVLNDDESTSTDQANLMKNATHLSRVANVTTTQQSPNDNSTEMFDGVAYDQDSFLMANESVADEDPQDRKHNTETLLPDNFGTKSIDEVTIQNTIPTEIFDQARMTKTQKALRNPDPFQESTEGDEATTTMSTERPVETSETTNEDDLYGSEAPENVTPTAWMEEKTGNTKASVIEDREMHYSNLRRKSNSSFNEKNVKNWIEVSEKLLEQNNKQENPAGRNDSEKAIKPRSLPEAAPILVMISADQIQFLKIGQEPPMYVDSSPLKVKANIRVPDVLVVPKTTPTAVEMIKVTPTTPALTAPGISDRANASLKFAPHELRSL